MKICILFTLLILIYFEEISGLTCFTCEGVDMESCAYAYNLRAQECPALNETSQDTKEFCLKTIYRRESSHIIRYGLDNNKVYDRGCARTRPGEIEFCPAYLHERKNVKCFTCEGDLCNGARENEVKAIIFIMAFLVVNYIKLQSYKD